MTLSNPKQASEKKTRTLSEALNRELTDAEHVRERQLMASGIAFTEVRGVLGFFYAGPAAFFIRDKNDFFHFVGMRDSKPEEFRGKKTSFFLNKIQNPGRTPYITSIDALGIAPFVDSDGIERPKLIDHPSMWKYIHKGLERFHLRVQAVEATATMKGLIIPENEIEPVRTILMVKNGDAVRFKHEGGPVMGKSEKGAQFHKKLSIDELKDMFAKGGEHEIEAGTIKYTMKIEACEEKVQLEPHAKWNFLT